MSIDLPRTDLVIGLIQSRQPTGMELLLYQEHPAESWRFVRAIRLQQESFRETIEREVAWKLGLDRRQLLVSSMAQLSVETQPDPEEHPLTVSFYPVQLYGAPAREQIADNSNTRWLSCAEICAGMTNDQQPIEAEAVRWINRWEILQPWR